jgi:hypothetical protein
MANQPTPMSYATEAKADAPDPRYVNEKYLLDIIKKQLGITDEDMKSISTVKAKVRDAKIDIILE